jgi:hypothetical protein
VRRSTLGLAMLLIACGDDDGPAGMNRGTAAPVPPASGDTTPEAGDGGGGSSAQPNGDLDVPVQAVVDSGCVPRGGVALELYPDDDGAPVFGRLEAVGGRWVTGDAVGLEGFATFEPDGSHPSSPTITIGSSGNRFASQGESLGVAALLDGGAVYQRFDELGMPLGQRIDLGWADPATVPAIAGAEERALVVWAAGGVLRGQNIDGDGFAAGEPFAFGAGTFTGYVSLAVSSRPGGFAVAWSGRDASGTERIWFATVTDGGLDYEPMPLGASAGRVDVVRLVATPDGFALLVTGPLPRVAPYVFLLDAAGAQAGPAFLLEGAFYAWDLAVLGDELGILAHRETGEPELRPFAADMSPLGPWVCLDEAGDIGDRGAIAAESAGYAVIYRRPDPDDESGGKQVFVRVDDRGTGAP